MEDQETITFSVPHGCNILTRLDSIRGPMKRSKVIRLILESILAQDDNYVRSFIGIKTPVENSSSDQTIVQ